MQVTIHRSIETLTDAKGARGRRLVIEAEAEPGGARLLLTAIERLDGFVWVKPGAYRAKMDRTRIGGRAEQVLRILQVPVVRAGGRREFTDRCLIHVANTPSELEGCIAPGLMPAPDGVRRSELAMDALWAVLSGFVAGLELELRVIEAGAKL